MESAVYARGVTLLNLKMLRKDLEIALMPAGCAIAFPKRYERHNKVLENEYNSDITLGIGALQVCPSGWDVALNELPKSKVRTDPRSMSKCRKRYKSPSLVLDNGQEDPNKKKKYDDSVEKSQESRIFRNSRMKKFKKKKLAKDDETVDSAMSPDKEKIKLKRKAEKCCPHAAEETIGFIDVQNDDKKVNNPSKKRRSRQTRKNKEKKSREERSLEDDLMFELQNFHIGSNSNISTETQSAAPKNLKGKHRNATQTTGSDILDVNRSTLNLKKLVKWTKRRWNKDQKGATLASSLYLVEVHNLPAVMSLVFQAPLFEVFEKYGRIKRIGPAIMHPSAEGECTFSTTICFETETAATKALEEDHTRFGGSEIRVLRPSTVDRCNMPEDIGESGGPGPECRGSMAVTVFEQDGPTATHRALALSGKTIINCEPSPVSQLRLRKIYYISYTLTSRKT
ncbi:uncharacterized protein LOC134754046 [Cydia strobilella]|uniref:uncharacterized protein LOC134754046 n=1 Tax=Cydia strobilella TaxID=1100964 RepID=UPI0030058D2E